jgi:hypothetical protein
LGRLQRSRNAADASGHVAKAGVVLSGLRWSVGLTLAFLPKYRLIGALGMAFVATASLIGVFVATGVPKALGELFIPALSLAGLLVNLWLIWAGATLLSAAK